MTPSPSEVHQTLIHARAILAERGLAKHTLEDIHGKVCLRGALILAVGSGISDINIPLMTACEKAMSFTNDGAPDWNNAPERTLEEVLERFDQGIKATRPTKANAGPGMTVRIQTQPRKLTNSQAAAANQADKLLREHLTTEQCAMLDEHGFFYLRGGDNRLYALTDGWNFYPCNALGQVLAYRQAGLGSRCCGYPRGDKLLTQLLILTSEPSLLVRISCPLGIEPPSSLRLRQSPLKVM